MADIFAIGFMENLKVFFVAVLMYAIVYAMLLKLEVFGDKKVNSLIALLSAIIVSFTGVLTYAVAYAINWFFIIFFILFLMVVLLLFLGVGMGEITGVVKNKIKIIMIVFLLLFSVILLKGFFAVNNTFDLNEPLNNSYDVDASFNTGVDDITNSEIDESFWDMFNIDSDLLAAILFLAGIGGFVLLMG